VTIDTDVVAGRRREWEFVEVMTYSASPLFHLAAVRAKRSGAGRRQGLGQR